MTILDNIVSNFLKDSDEGVKIVTFFFLHREIIKALDSVYSGYKTGDYRFIPPDSGLGIDEHYEEMLHTYHKLWEDPVIQHYLEIKNLPFTSLTMYRSLLNDFDFYIKCWNHEHDKLLEEKREIDLRLSSDEGIEKNIKLVAYELRKLLNDHEKIKKEKLDILYPSASPRFLRIDLDSMILWFKGKAYPIPRRSEAIIFLQVLSDRMGALASYKVLADATSVSANTPHATDEEIRRAVQDVKNKSMRPALLNIGIPLDDVLKIIHAITPVEGVGYRFFPQLP